MKVRVPKSTSIPERNRRVISAGTEYEIDLEEGDDCLGEIVGDNGEVLLILIPGCVYLDCQAWEIVEG